MKRILLFAAIAAGVSGCSTGRMVCEWQTQDERFQDLIEVVIEEMNEDET